jgi:hypothetical protein
MFRKYSKGPVPSLGLTVLAAIARRRNSKKQCGNLRLTLPFFAREDTHFHQLLCGANRGTLDNEV